ncbi:cartilage matrix protein [Exaiptasia diaphana]|uniref:VWFA domain-containing protein n=1 Tax=Exaiptasia diaphana TaxID=2652724 RepID=A0A913XRD4_EXADI|nr:cartilage matrix protein [Exaiptasia diaphana]KXJ24856.1 Collagen alpha-5(VI) chain [Exaiptasia diaphana]
MKLLVIALISVFTISCCEKCKKPIDLAIILDSSRSMSKYSWRKVQEFAKALVGSIGEVSKSGSHVAVMRFSTEPEIDLSFKEFNSDKFGAQNVKDRIDNLKHMKGFTFLDRALLLTNKKIFTTAAGMREDKEINKIVVVLTDGMQTISHGPYTPLYDASEQLRKKSIEIYTVGVGPSISLQQLVDVSTSPNYVYSVPGFDSLLNEVEKIQLIKCDCYEPLDIGFIIDSSSTVEREGFRKAMNATVNLLKLLHIGEGDDKSHFGLIKFSHKANTTVEYNFTDSQDFATAAKKIKSIKTTGGGTDTSYALKLANTTFFQPGLNGNRENISDIAIVFTDGDSKDGYDGVNSIRKEVPIIAVGIGEKIKKRNLVILARNNANMTIQVDDFDELKKKLDDIVQLTC